MSRRDVAERARGELLPGESLLYSEKAYHSLGFGIFFLLLGVLGICASAMPVIMGVSAGDFWWAVFFTGLMGTGGLFFLWLGYYSVFIVAKNYLFITEQRLCIRGRYIWGKSMDRDIPIASIESIFAYRQDISVRVKNQKKHIGFKSLDVARMLAALKTALRSCHSEDAVKEIMAGKHEGGWGTIFIAFGAIFLLIGVLVFVEFLPGMLAPKTIVDSHTSDPKLAALQKAAEQGDAHAQGLLGAVYYYGHGVPRDDVRAAQWLQKAAEQGLAEAQAVLGVMYHFGRGVPKDEAKALQWSLKAAEQGDARAQAQLGRMYRFGQGVPKDEAKAVQWLQKAAEQGYFPAQNMLKGGPPTP